jgi:hypothetical protein
MSVVGRAAFCVKRGPCPGHGRELVYFRLKWRIHMVIASLSWYVLGLWPLPVVIFFKKPTNISPVPRPEPL